MYVKMTGNCDFFILLSLKSSCPSVRFHMRTKRESRYYRGIGLLGRRKEDLYVDDVSSVMPLPQEL